METQEKSKLSFLHTPTARFVMVGFLTLMLLIPLEFVKSLIGERKYRQYEVIQEVNDKWGEEVMIYGPILKVPYLTYSETTTINTIGEVIKERKSETNYAYFFPEDLNANAEIETKTLKRGNYESVVFTSDVDFTGRFVMPNFKKKDIASEDIVWEKATMLVRTTNLKSIKDEVVMKFGNKSYTFEPIYSSDNYGMQTLSTGYINAQVFEETANRDFSFSLHYNGSKELSIIPIGKTTQTHVNSNWHSPSFNGNFLPSDETKKIDNNGFSADWKILHINRPFAQESFNELPYLDEFAYGIDFIIPNDEYQQNERTSKYGLLVISLTFLVFFMIQAINKLKVHLFQYVMIGIALVLFYTLLLSITEHSSFKFAYLIATSSVIGMISLYSLSVLKARKFALFIGASLLSIYAFIYIIIQMENYALLAGSIGLFLILGAVMYFSRKIDWGGDN